MPKFYQVKPEFDGTNITLRIPDKRCKTGFRTDAFYLVAYELIDEKTHSMILSQHRFKSDLFIEKQLSKKEVYWSFGCMFFVDEEFDGEKADKAKKLHQKLSNEAYRIYSRHLYSINSDSMGFATASLVIHLLSNDSLMEVIEHYKEKGEK